MLRSITKRDPAGYRLELHGSLAGEWVPLLEREWRALAAADPATPVTVVIADIVFIDPAGERLLRRMENEGATLFACGAMNRYVVGKVRASAKPPRGGKEP